MWDLQSHLFQIGKSVKLGLPHLRRFLTQYIPLFSVAEIFPTGFNVYSKTDEIELGLSSCEFHGKIGLLFPSDRRVTASVVLTTPSMSLTSVLDWNPWHHVRALSNARRVGAADYSPEAHDLVLANN